MSRFEPGARWLLLLACLALRVDTWMFDTVAREIAWEVLDDERQGLRQDPLSSIRPDSDPCYASVLA